MYNTFLLFNISLTLVAYILEKDTSNIHGLLDSGVLKCFHICNHKKKIGKKFFFNKFAVIIYAPLISSFQFARLQIFLFIKYRVTLTFFQGHYSDITL